MSNGTIKFVNYAGKFELEVTTFQMAVLFLWNGNEIPTEKNQVFGCSLLVERNSYRK